MPAPGADPAWGGPAPDRPTRPASNVAIVGAGLMGGAMLARLVERGWSVAVCDTDPLRQQQALDAGAELAETPALAAAQLTPDGALIVCVVDAAQSREVLFGAGGAARVMKPGQTVLLCPTIAPEDTEALAAALREQRIDCVDAPMSGGPQRARQGQMSLMLAAPPPVLARLQALLGDLSNQVFVIGERAGDGARTKLVNNLLAGINLVGAAEALALAERLGLDAAATLAVIEASSGQSWIGSDRMRRALAGDTPPRAQMTLLEKDTGLAVAAARAVGFVGPLGGIAAATFKEAHASGMGEADDSALLELLRQRPNGP